MDRKNVCKLCLVSNNEILELFGDEGIKLNIPKILAQHFWFQIHRDDNLPIGICRMCWKYVNDFHEFYKKIKVIHTNYYENLQFKNDLKIFAKIESEIIDSNNCSLSCNNQSNMELIENVVNTNGKSKPKCAEKTIKNESSSKITQKNEPINSTKKNVNKKLTEDILKMNQPIKKIEQESPIIKDCSIVISDIINCVKSENQSEFDDLSNDNNIDDYDNNSFIENQDEEDKDEKYSEDIKIKEFYNLICEMCSSQHYSTFFELKKHYREAHNTKHGYVLCCNKKLISRRQLLEHIIWHTNPDEFTCKVCNQIYVNKNNLKIHMHFHSTPEERKYICDICGVGFTVKYLLMKHFRRIHPPQKNIEYKCNQCNKSFNKNSKLQSHIRGVHEHRNVTICEVCAKVYKSKKQCEIHYLDEHLNVNKSKLKCNLCDSMLKNKSRLKFHMRRKHLEAPVSCKLCNKISPNRHALRKHLRDVHAERKHKCNLCDKAFARPHGLKEHMATHYGNSYLYPCPYCTASFNSDANMYSHRKRKHSVEWLEDRQRRLGIIAVNDY